MPKIVDHDKRRWEILNRSLPLFAQEGYQQLTMRKLAKKLQVTTGVLYHYFENKEKMFDELLRYVLRTHQDLVEQFKQGQALPVQKQWLVEVVKQFEEELSCLVQISLEYLRIHKTAPVIEEILLGYQQALERHFLLSRQEAKAVISLILGQLLKKMFGIKSNLQKELSLIIS